MRVCVMSVPHTGTHSCTNILEGLGIPKYLANEDEGIPQCYWRQHFEYDRALGIEDMLDWATHIIVPLRTPWQTLVSVTRRNLQRIPENRGLEFILDQSLLYTNRNWAVLDRYLDDRRLKDALFVGMNADKLPCVEIADYLGEEWPDTLEVGVGNKSGLPINTSILANYDHQLNEADATYRKAKERL